MEEIVNLGQPKYLDAPNIDFSNLAKINDEIMKKSFGIPLFGTICDKDSD